MLLVVVDPVPAATRTWDGGGADNNASNPTNWVGDGAPSAADDIVLDATSTKDMAWDTAAPTSLSSWTQGAGYTGRVTFDTKQPGQGAPTNITITGNCLMDNGVWTHPVNGGTDVSRLNISVHGSFTLAAAATINVSSNGLLAAGLGRGLSEGAGYGGQGGIGNNKNGGPTYGSVRAPTHSGSGGNQGRGGGAVRLSVLGTTTVDGTIEAQGQDLTASWVYSGSGGSVFLTTANLGGSGSIRVRGGHGQNVGAGGGGRIAIILTGSESFGSLEFSAIGGDANPDHRSAAAGTIYLESQSQGTGGGLLLITNLVDVFRFTDISSNVTDTMVGSLLIGDNGRFQINTDQTFTVGSVWSNGNGFVGQAGSRAIITASNGTARVYGSSTFAEFAAEQPGQTIFFEPGSTNAVSEKVILQGSSSTDMLLRSISGGSQWSLDFAGSAIQEIRYVNVQDSDADPGSAAVALDSVNSGNNSNWVFGTPGQTDTWTGAVDDQWGEGGNWDLGRAPIALDAKTVISAAGTNDASLPSDQMLNHIEVQNGAGLSLVGYDLTVVSALDVDGILTATGTETITAHGDIDFTSGTFEPAQSRVILTSTNAQSITSGGEAFHHLIVTSKSAIVTFADAASAEFFDSHGASCVFGGGLNAWRMWNRVEGSSVTQSFATGSSSVITNLYVLGDPGATIFLRRTGGAGQWTLNAVRCAHVRHADVMDADAGAGIEIHPLNSTDSGNNDNWDFGSTWATWNGVFSADFLASSNWTPVAVPGAGTRVLLDGNATNALVITNAATLSALVIGPSLSSSMTVAAPLMIQEDLKILRYGAVAIDRPAVISNNVVVADGGEISHTTNHEDITNTLHLTILADLFVYAGGHINADRGGYGPSRGPGKPKVSNAAATHGGQGGSNNPGNAGPTYGSITEPTNAGSGAASTAGPWNGAGGGVVRVDVLGATTVDGMITANGGTGVSWTYQGSGGSVYLTTGSLEGEGAIQAHGGNIPSSGGAGGGGRVAVVVSGGGFDDVSITARAGTSNGGIPRGAPGTVYLKSGVSARTIVEQDLAHSVYTMIPSETNAPVREIKSSTLILANVGARVQMAAHERVSDLFIYTNAFMMLDYTGGFLVPDTYTLTVGSPEHHLDSTVRGPGGTNRVDIYTQIIWTGKGTVLVFQ
jgi:hypothetical protein